MKRMLGNASLECAVWCQAEQMPQACREMLISAVPLALGVPRLKLFSILAKLFYMVRPAKHVVRFCQEIATSVRPSNI